MEFDLLIFLVLGFASYRITRFFLIDSFFEGSRDKFHTFLINKQGRGKLFWHKLYDLTSCTWCWGFWVSVALYSLYLWVCPIDFNQIDVVNVFAIAGVQGLLHSWEFDGDE